MRWVSLALAVCLFAIVHLPPAAAHAAHESQTGNHSPNVAEVAMIPAEPKRGEAVSVYAILKSAAGVDHVVVTSCRVQNYACRLPLTMQAVPKTNGTFYASFPWDPQFFRGVTDVGFSLVLRYSNGTEEKSPVADFPARPSALPAEAGAYYFLHFPPEPAKSPSFGWMAPALCAAWAAGRKR